MEANIWCTVIMHILFYGTALAPYTAIFWFLFRELGNPFASREEREKREQEAIDQINGKFND